MQTPSSGKPYFPGLHALRAYAALSVVVVHTGLYSGWVGKSIHWPLLDRLALSGADAVSVFLVLSGFLITYLLLHEQAQAGAIDVGAFYRRRVLRIWPLYFGVLAFCGLMARLLPGVMAFADMNNPAVLIPLVTFTLNLNLIGASGSAMLVLWSVGMEEQFYAVWPLLFRRFSVPKLALAATALYLAVIALLNLFDSVAAAVLARSCYDLLALGALAAWGVHERRRWIGAARHPLVRILIVAWFTMIILADYTAPSLWHGILYDHFVGLLAALLIVNIVGGWGVIENRVTRHLGNISYGLYVLHPLVIFVLVTLGIRHEALYVAALVGTIGAASVSYRYFERPFLRLKDRTSSPRRVLAPAGD